MVPIPYQIIERQQETSDVFTLSLEPCNGDALMHFGAGQFNMLYVYGVGEVPISISSDPDYRQPVDHTIRAVGTVTNATAKLPLGATVGVRGPFGTSWPVEEAKGKNVIIIAGGIGLAPIRPAICQIANRRREYGHVIILYGARTPQDVLFSNDLITWQNQYDMEVHVTVDNATEAWFGNVGFVTELIKRSTLDSHNSIAMMCGPEVMMRYSAQELNKHGLTNEQIYVTMERNMKCAIGFCGHCQLGPEFVCKDGPVFRFDRVRRFFELREV